MPLISRTKFASGTRALKFPGLQRRSLLLAAFLVIAPVVHGQLVSDANLVVPAAPATLLSMLPQPPENWTVTKSIGMERPSVNLVPETFVMREFLFVPPPPPQPPVTPPPPQTVRVTLIDAGNDPLRFGDFTNFAPDAPNSTKHAGFRKKLVESLPAIEIKRDAMDELDIAINPRVLLAVHTVNVDDDTRDRWIRQMQLSKIVTECQALPAIRLTTKTYVFECIDEQHPAKNSKSNFDYITKADLAAMIKAEHEAAAAATHRQAASGAY